MHMHMHLDLDLDLKLNLKLNLKLKLYMNMPFSAQCMTQHNTTARFIPANDARLNLHSAMWYSVSNK